MISFSYIQIIQFGLCVLLVILLLGVVAVYYQRKAQHFEKLLNTLQEVNKKDGQINRVS